MAYPYSQTFPASLTQGQIAPGWTADSGTWQVQSGGFGLTSAADGDFAQYTGSGTIGSGGIQIGATISGQLTNATAHYMQYDFVLCSTSTSTGYLVQFNIFVTGSSAAYQVSLFSIAGGYTKIGAQYVWNVPAASNPTYSPIVQVSSSGQVAWSPDNGGVWFFPPDWTITYSSSTYVGFRSAASSAPGVALITQVNISQTLQAYPSQIIETRPASNEVIAAGSTYNSITAYALAAPHSGAYDPVAGNWPFTVSLYNNSNSKWYSIFFTTPDLVTWTYVANSLLTPQGSDTLLGNGTVLRIPATYNSNAGKYAFFAQHYNSSAYISQWLATTLSGFVAGSPTDNIVTHGTADANAQNDVHSCINPVNGNIELVYTGTSAGSVRSLMYSTDSGQSLTFGAGTVVFSSSDWDINAYFGEPSIFYANGPDGSPNCRWWTWDAGGQPGYRVKAIGYQLYNGSTWGAGVKYGICLYPLKANNWESAQVFDGGGLGVFNRGDGKGAVLWQVYAGSNQAWATNPGSPSSIGVAYLLPPASAYTASIASSSGSVPTTEVITYTLNGYDINPVVITPSVSDVYGTVSPTTVTIPAGSLAGTTTYGVNAEGVTTVTSTNNGGLSDPAGVTFTGAGSDTPGAITNTGATDTTLSFTATEATGSAGYLHQWWRRLHNTGDYAAIYLATTLSPFVDTGLSPATAYDYALTYTTLAGASVVAFLSNVTTDATLVAGTISETGHTTTTLSFTATNCSGGTPSYTYQWARRLHGSGSYVNIGGATSLTLNDTGLTAGTAYDYQLTYTDAVSNTATAYALNVSTDTAVVAGTISNTSKTTTTLAFSATNATGGTGTYTYQWGYRLHGGGAYSSFGTNSLTASLTGLTAGTAYDIQLVYTDTDTNTATATLSNVSTDSTITAGTITAGTITPTTIPLTATNATGGTGTYTYQWGYRLHGIGSYVNFGTSSLTQTLTGLSPSTAYDVKLVYTDTDSNTATATLLNVSTLASSMIDTGQFQSSIGIGAWR